MMTNSMMTKSLKRKFLRIEFLETCSMNIKFLKASPHLPTECWDVEKVEQKTERKCNTLYKKECKPVQKSLQRTRYDNICVKNQQYKTIPMKQYHTVYSTINKTIQYGQCRKVEEQLCHRVLKEQYKDVSTRKCSTTYEKKCHPVTTEECMVVHY